MLALISKYIFLILELESEAISAMSGGGLQNLPIGCQLVTKFGNDDELLDYSKTIYDNYLK